MFLREEEGEYGFEHEHEHEHEHEEENMTKLTLRDLDVRGKRVLVRVDFNVPTEEQDGQTVITDDTRIRESLPTINHLREQGAKTILMAHFGRPKGKPVEKYSLRPVADYLHTLINHPVAFSHDTIGKIPEEIIGHMKEGDVTLLENVRFHPGEEANDPAFAEALAKLGDLYVNDAFGAAHRAHASTAGITKFVPQSAMGFLMEKEIQYLSGELAEPAKPFVVILGGSKVSDKIGVIKALMEKADAILIGGAMANTFWKAQGVPIGASRVEADKLDLAREILDLAKDKGSAVLAAGGCARSGQDRSRRHGPEHQPGHAHPRDHGRLASRRYRPCHDQPLRRRNRQSENDSLERPGRNLRDSCLCRRHDRDRRSARPLQGDDHHRRRRFGHGGEAGGPRRQNDVHLHRRRRVA